MLGGRVTSCTAVLLHLRASQDNKGRQQFVPATRCGEKDGRTIQTSRNRREGRTLQPGEQMQLVGGREDGDEGDPRRLENRHGK